MKFTSLVSILPLLGIIEAGYPISSRGYYSGSGSSAKRYGFGNVRRNIQWVPYRPLMRNQRSPLGYYTAYPYNQIDNDNNYFQYYPQETYPIYYRSSKYDTYHPSYYRNPELIDNYSGYYYDIDPEELLQQVEREEREESQPIGHEMLYENEDYTNNNNVNDKPNLAYFQNLMKNKQQHSFSDYNDDYENEWQDIPATKLPPTHRRREDKEVQDLRKLKTKSESQRKFKSNDYKRTLNEITSSVPKTQKKYVETIKLEPTTISPNTLNTGSSVGQKEEVMIRPATPVRNPLQNNNPLMGFFRKNEERKRNHSVFDTLKRMLEMEKNLKNKYGEEDIRQAMKKRIVSDEDSLIRQLTVLKKS